MTNIKGGFSTIEMLISIGIFGMLTLGIVGAISFGLQATAFAGMKQRATYIAQEGVEAVRNIRDISFGSLTDGNHGLSTSGNVWGFNGTQDISGIYTRQITISTIDSATKQVTSTVTWPQNSGQVTITQYLTSFQTAAAPTKGGMAVFANGGTSANTMSYQFLDGATNTWTTPQNTLNVDTNVTNKVPYYLSTFASSTRNEKILLSRHYNGTTQFIYAQVWNGSSWGNLVLQSSFATNTFLDVQNFNGTYLSNGDFMSVYSDNTTIPKFRVWNGAAWGAQLSMQNLGSIPVYIIAKVRPATNEVMSVLTAQNLSINSSYFNGGTYLTTNWSALTNHATSGSLNTVQVADFDWSGALPTKGSISYNTGNSATTKTQISEKIWTANGVGSGSWGSALLIGTFANTAGSISVSGRLGTTDFMICAKDFSIPPTYSCVNTTNTPTVTNTTILSNTTDPGIQRSFSVAAIGQTGGEFLSVYSDNSTIPKFNQYLTNTWGTQGSATSALTGNLTTVQVINKSYSNDLMVLMGDNSNRIYSVVWNGTAKSFYTTPTGNAFTTIGSNGPSIPSTFWFNFVWDNF